MKRLYKLLLIGWGILLAGIIVLLCEVVHRADRLDSKIGDVSEQIGSIEIPEYQCDCKKEETEEIATETDAATPTEAECTTEEAITTEVYSETLSEPQEDTEEVEVVLEAIEIPEAQEEASGELVYAGIFELTAYTWTGNPCANGNYPTAGYTVASNYFPLGTRIYIEGMGEYVVEDTGGMSANVIDIYIEGSDNCRQFGRRQAGVYVIE